MSWVSALAIYFIIWWVVWFAVLPWGVRAQVEADEVVPGSAPSAPVRPLLRRKVIATTIAAAIVFALLQAILHAGFGLDDLPLFDPFGHILRPS